MRAVIVRPAETRDEAIFLELSIGLSKFNRAHRDFGPINNHLEERVKRCREIFGANDDKQLILIAEAEGKALGYGLCNYFERRGSIVGYIDELYVKEEARGLGLGKQLMNSCMEWMKERGATRVTLNAFAFNQNALAIYEKDGFKVYAMSLEKQL